MLFKNMLNPKNEPTSLKEPAPWFMEMFGVGSSSGERVTTSSALGVPAVYACVNVLANSVAKLPLQTFKRSGSERERDKNHQVAKLLESRPNPFQSPFKFKHLIETHRNLWGNAYINIDWRADGRPQALWLMDPSKTEPVVDTETNEVWYQTTLPNGTKTKIPYTDIVHLAAMTTDGVKGKPPIQAAREAIGSSQAAQKFKGKFFQNGAANSGFLKIPGTLNREAKDAIRTEWERNNTGLDNAQRVAILDAGLDFESVSMPLKDAQFVEGMKYDKTEIATIFSVPLHMVNELDRSTHSNIEQQTIDFIQNTLSPILRQYEEEFSYQLFSLGEQKRYYLKFNLESLLRADKKTQAEFYRTMLDIGVYSINEVRALEERNSIEGGDSHRVDLNHVSISIADEYQLAKAGSTKGGEENQND